MKKNALLFIVSNIVNRFGDSVDLIAFMWLTYEVTNSVILTGVVAAFNGLPSIILGLFSGVITDRLSKKRLIIIGDLCRGGLVSIIVILFYTNMLNIYILCVATILISTFEILSTPARRSILPFIVDKEDLRRINSKNSAGKTISQILGLSMAGIIINHFGLAVAVMVDAITFFLSALLIGGIRIIGEEVVCRNEKGTFISELKEGLVAFKNEKIVLKTTIMATVVNLFIGGFSVMTLGYCSSVIKNNSQGQSIINALNVVGILLVSLAFSYIKKQISLEKIINTGFVGLGISLILFGICNYSIGAYIIAVMYGMATGCITVSSVTILQHNIPLQHMGKVMALVSLINESSVPLGNILASFMIEHVGVSNTFLWFGILIVLLILLIRYVFKCISKE